MEEKNKIRGKKARASGKTFELIVRKDLEKKNWIVIKNSNNVIDNQFKQGKIKFNIFTKRLMMNSGGFPDFLCFQNAVDEERRCLIGEFEKLSPLEPNSSIRLSGIIAVECKSKGYLDKVEKEKCSWLIENGIFNKIIIASKGKQKAEIQYKEFK